MLLKISKTIFLKLLLTLIIGDSLAMTEEEFIKMVINYQPLQETDKIRLQLKQLDLEQSKSSYGDWRWLIQGNAGVEKTYTDKDYTSFSSTKVDFVNTRLRDVKSISTSLEKNFFATGVNLNLTLKKSVPTRLERITNLYTMEVNNSFETELKTNEFLNSAKVKLNIPLLKNLGGMIDKKPYLADKIDLENKKLTNQFKLEQTLAKYLNLFLKLAYFDENINILNKVLELNQRYFLYVKNFNNQNNIDLIKDNIVKIKEDILENQKSFYDYANELSIKLNYNFNKTNVKVNWYKQVNFVSNIKKYLIKKNLILKKINIQQKINQLNLKVYRNSKLPELDLDFYYERIENLGNYSTYTYLNQDVYTVELSFAYYLFEKPSDKYKLAKERLKTRLLALEYRKKLEDLKTQVKNVVFKIRESQQKIINYQDKLKNLTLPTDKEFNGYLEQNKNIKYLINQQNEWLKNKKKLNNILLSNKLNHLNYDKLLNRLLK